MHRYTDNNQRIVLPSVVRQLFPMILARFFSKHAEEIGRIVPSFFPFFFFLSSAFSFIAGDMRLSNNQLSKRPRYHHRRSGSMQVNVRAVF